jgi:DNA-binding PadR family transcriptional regulator
MKNIDYNTAQVLLLLKENKRQWFSLDIMHTLKLSSTAVHVALIRLEKNGQVSSGWDIYSKRPRRRWYQYKETENV